MVFSTRKDVKIASNVGAEQSPISPFYGNTSGDMIHWDVARLHDLGVSKNRENRDPESNLGYPGVGGMLTSLATCSRHVSFVSFGGWLGYIYIYVNMCIHIHLFFTIIYI